MTAAKIAAAIAQARKINSDRAAAAALDDVAVIIGRTLEAAGELTSFDAFISACGAAPVGGMRSAPR